LRAACQGIDLRKPLKVQSSILSFLLRSSAWSYTSWLRFTVQTTAPLEELHKLIRSKVAPWDKDRYFHPDIELAVELLRNGELIKTVAPFRLQTVDTSYPE